MSISDSVVRELLSPESPLVTQTPELRAALNPLDGYAARSVLIDLCDQVSPEARHVLSGLSLYWQHLTAVRKGNLEVASDTFHRARDQFDGLLNDLRRLGSLAEGIALGGLYPEAYQEACDLVHSVFGKESPEATAILSRMKRKRRSLWGMWLNFLANERQLTHIRRTDEDAVHKLPTRATDQAGQNRRNQ